MSRGSFFRLSCLAAVFIVAAMSYQGAEAVEVPPTPTAHYYGDADGNVSVNLSDIAQHNAYSSFRPCTYDTLQPQTGGQYWNTCDVDGNRSCNLSDIAILNSYMSFKPVNLGGDPWALENVNLPLNGNSLNTWIPFNINLYMTYAGQPSGRSGISVVAEIDPTSPGHGQLSGRSCTPVAGTRDQLAPAGAQCALAVTITDWQPSHEGEGITESGTYGFKVWGDGDGDLKIDFRVEERNGMDIPEVVLSQTINFSCGIRLQCPPNVAENAPISCPVYYNDLCTDVLTVGPADSCIGSSVTDNGDGTGSYNAPAQGETAGPGLCIAEVQLVSDGAFDMDNVVIDEVNEAPTIVVDCPPDVDEDTSAICPLTVSDADIPAQALTCLINAATTCNGASTAGCSQVNIPAQGEAAPASCDVVVDVIDNYSPTPGTGQAADSIILNETNQIPAIVVDCPSNIGENTNLTCPVYASDADVPPQAISCSIDASTTCSGVTLIGCTQVNIPAQGEGSNPRTCDVAINVQDDFSPTPGSNQDTATITIDDQNADPAWDPAPLDITVITYEVYNSANGHGYDIDPPALTLTCSKSAQTCSFNITVSGSGSGETDCNFSFTAGSVSEQCTVDVELSDGAGGFNSDTVAVIVSRVWYVDDTATGTNNGSSWTDAFNAVQDAVNAASVGDQVWVAEGTYSTGTATSVLTMKAGVDVYGGFAGTENNLLQRGYPPDHPTILDGLNVTSQVVRGSSNAIMDGFVVQNGLSNGMSNNNLTGLEILNCSFINNTRGIYNMNSDIALRNCIFSGGDTTGNGGAVYNTGCTIELINCVFRDNAASVGGGLYNLNSPMTITNCTFTANTAGWGGAVYNIDSSPVITNSILWNDTATVSGQELQNDGTSSPVVTYSDVDGGYSGTGNIDTDPLFVGYPDLHLQPISPCADTGTAGVAPTVDLEGAFRPSGSGYDMGAYEYFWGPQCSDTYDNDGDTLIDWPSDPGCSDALDMSERGSLVCDDGLDNDGDTIIDWPDDPGCTGVTDTSEYGSNECDDNLDNDGDTLTDWLGDPGCFGDYAGLTETGECQDTVDNDGDTSADFPNDPGCDNAADTSELGTNECDDGLDNDGDTFADFPEDPGCSSPMDTSELGTNACDDGADNDGDTLIDYPDDPGCLSPIDTSEYMGTVCDDGADNDGDTATDFPDDPGCSSLADTSELGTNECDDGSDNDGDTLTDFPDDPGCSAIMDTSEYGTNECDDGADNDNDYLVDYPDDPGCTSVTDTSEYLGTQCDDGVDNDGDTLIDYPLDDGCIDIYDFTENFDTECDDTFDNDGDTLVDYPEDPGCDSPADTSEYLGTECDDGQDNDGDTFIDWPSDDGCHSFTDTTETFGANECDDGIDNDGDTSADFPDDAGCSSIADTSEYGTNDCDDGLDNDGDTLVDYPDDQGCESAWDTNEYRGTQCDDAVDNDGDTFTDWPDDPQCTSVTDSSEFPTWYVNDDATGAGTGLTWEDAFNNVQQAVDVAQAGEEIWVAQGNYYRPTGGNDPVLTMKDGVKIYGGFAGNETELNQRGDPTSHPTILDGENLSYHVVLGASEALIDGFTVTGGNSQGGLGAGFYNDSVGNLIVENCTITNNVSKKKIMGCCAVDDYDYMGSGGGMYNYNSEVTVRRCNFDGNVAAYYGGAIFNDQSTAVIDSCIITNNTAFGHRSEFVDNGMSHYVTNRYDHGVGGGVYSRYSSEEFTTCLIGGNDAWEGAGIFSTALNSNIIKNSTIAGNEGHGDSYYMCYGMSGVGDDDCVLYWEDDSSCGGAYIGGSTDISVTNTIIYSNTASYNLNLCMTNGLNVSYSDIGGGYAGTGNIDANPLFVSSSDAHLQSGSPCKNTGTSIRMPLYDLDGNPRPMGGTHDMGAYELAGIYACEDGLDNDGDTLIDFPVDPGCAALTDTSEYSSAECDDAVDNDGDTYVDFLDPGCSGLTDNDENGDNECDDGVDNDADTLVDWPADTGCTDIFDNDEYPGEDCYDGVDNDGDTYVDWPNDPGCDNIADTSEYLGTPCDDGVDNDGNTLIDWPADPGCTDMYDNSEGPCVLDLQCSDTWETNPIVCPIVYSGCTDTLTIEPSNTCTGASVTDNGNGTGTYNAPAQGEAVGPGSCTAAVELQADSLMDYDNINILESNGPPNFWYIPYDWFVFPGQFFSETRGGATDGDLPNANPGDPGYLTCVLMTNGCPFAINVTGQGPGSVNCTLSFTTPLDSGYCGVEFGVCDGYGRCESGYFQIECF